MFRKIQTLLLRIRDSARAPATDPSPYAGHYDYGRMMRSPTEQGSPAQGSPTGSSPTGGGLSDLLLAQYLVQETDRAANPLRWREASSGALACESNGVRVALEEIQSRGGRFLALRLTCGEDTTQLIEPFNRHFFGAKNDHRQVAELLNRLQTLAIAQIARRREEAMRNSERIRQSLYRRLILGDYNSPPGD